MVVFAVRLPPAIIKGPKVHHIFRDSAKVDMTCVATASVHIEYVFRLFILQLIQS